MNLEEFLMVTATYFGLVLLMGLLLAFVVNIKKHGSDE